MLNAIWVFLVLASVLFGAYMGRMDLVAVESMKAAKGAVMLALGLVGVMAFWLGMMNVAQEAGLLQWIARKIRPLMKRLFPEVPDDHPAMSAMVMNMASNMLGLANAATPFGIKAMMELDKLNPKKGVATNAMALFLAINTSNVALLPTGVIGVRTALGSNNPSGILITTLFATCCSTIAAIFIAKMLANSRWYKFEKSVAPLSSTTAEGVEMEAEKGEEEASKSDDAEEKNEEKPRIKEDDLPQEKVEEARGGSSFWAKLLQIFFWGAFLFAAVLHVGYRWLETVLSSFVGEFSNVMTGALWIFPEDVRIFPLFRDLLAYWMLPALIAALVLYGVTKKIDVYGALVSGAKEGFDVAIRIIPFLVAILVAIGMFRASGGLDVLVSLFSPLTNLIGMPAEALPMALLRPLSGSGAFGVMAETLKAHGPDSLIGYMVSTFQGSTETTFYVLAVYFGAVHIKKIRHTLIACLIADTVGILAAVWICRIMFG